MTLSTSRFALSLLSAALVLGLSACGNKDGKNVATQVVAKVGSEEISVHQINQVLSRTFTEGTAPDAAQAMSRVVLEKLIDQQIAVDQAIENKLHRTPEVLSQIEAARREILTRAYMQKIASALPKPSAEDAKTYFAEHPQLFSQRRIFNVQEIVAPMAAGTAEQLRRLAATSKPIDEAAAWLKSKNIKFAAGSATRAAEEIPLELLAQVSALKDGQSTVLEAPESITLLHVISSQRVPIDEATALPRIEQFLGNQRASEAVAANIRKLRTDTKITYMGDFAKSEGAAPTTVLATTSQAEATDDKARTAIEKGVAAFK